jgi:hypothetical protein
MTLPESYQAQVQYLQPSPKFRRSPADGTYEPVPFPGYTVITPPWSDETLNHSFYQELQILQQQLANQFTQEQFVALPPASFHLTLADLIWNDDYRHADKDPAFQTKLRESIAHSFTLCQPQVTKEQAACWQVVGLMLMPRAIAVALIPKDQDSYDRVIYLRRAIYQNSALMALGIEQQYHLTAHITLGYFGEAIAHTDRSFISPLLSDLNQKWMQQETLKNFQIQQAELRQFSDMTNYVREPNWPHLRF